METGWKIIKYDEWCPKCKYQNTSPTEWYCNECLTECARYNDIFERRMIMDTATYKLVVIGFDMVPREIGNYTMFEIQDFVRYAKAVNPCTTATIYTFGLVAIVVQKIDTSYSACTAFDGKEN